MTNGRDELNICSLTMQTAMSHFPAVAEHFDSSLALQTIRIGLDYKLGETAIDHDIFTKSITRARARSVRISWSSDVYRTIRRAVSVTLYRPAEPLAQSGP